MSLKSIDHFSYLGNNILSTESDAKLYLEKAWTAIDRLSIIWKSDLSDKIKLDFFLPVAVSIQLYRCTTWSLTKRVEEMLDGDYTRTLHAVLNKSWNQHPTKQQLYSHLPPISKTIQVKWTRHAKHCWWSKDELMDSYGLLQMETLVLADEQRLSYIRSVQSGYSLEDLSGVTDDRDGGRERQREKESE